MKTMYDHMKTLAEEYSGTKDGQHFETMDGDYSWNRMEETFWNHGWRLVLEDKMLHLDQGFQQAHGPWANLYQNSSANCIWFYKVFIWFNIVFHTEFY